MNGSLTEKNDKFIPRLFLHFLDLYHYRLAKNVFKYPDNLIFSELRLAFRLAFLLSSEMFISGSAYFENAITRKIIKEHLEICEAGFIFITSRDPTLSDHFERKREIHFDENSPAELQSSYRKMPTIPILYKSGNIKTSQVITKQWYETVSSGHLITFLDPNGTIQFSKNFEETWQKIPDLLGKRAFVASHVIQGFNKLGVIPPSELGVLKILDPGYTLSHADPLKCGLVDDLLYIQPPWSIKSSYPGFSYKTVREQLIYYDLLTLINNSDCNSLLRLRLSPMWNAFIPNLISKKGEYDNQTQELSKEIKRFLFLSGIELKEPPVKIVGKQTREKKGMVGINQPTEPIDIFCCYAHEDKVLLDELRKHLAPLQRQGLISIWHDADISAGSDWEEEIKKHLNKDKIILLLISPDFIASDYCYGFEMQQSMKRHEQGEALVVPIILRPVYWENAPFGKLQALPREANPITSSKWSNLDEAFFDVVEGIHRIIKKLTSL